MESCKTEIEKILYQSFPILARHPVLNEMSGAIFFKIDAQGFRKTKNENLPTWEIEVTS